jgi:phosphate starvation-inducible protein PhoH and related proteins
LQEKEIEIEGINPVELFGANNAKFNEIKKYFPKLKIVARGNTIKASGEPNIIEEFEKKIEVFIRHIHKYNSLSISNIENIMELTEEEVFKKSNEEDVIVYGNSGVKIYARTPNQKSIVDATMDNDMVFAIGPAGTGKTYTAVALAVRALKNKEIKRIILTRPAVEAGENLGFLPGDLKEKLDPYLQPLYDALRDMIPAEKLQYYFENGIIQIAPLAFMRGRTLDKAFVILDEAQNATIPQIKMFLTRMGKQAKFLITGDVSQVDLPKNQTSGLAVALKILKDVNGIAIVHLDGRDVIRHRIVKSIIAAFEKDEHKKG